MNIPSEWLTQRVESAPTSYQSGFPPVAALQTRMAWQKLKRQAREGDEVWAFSSSAETPKRRARYSGYALVRQGAIIQSALIQRR